MTIRVFLVDDHLILRTGLRDALAKNADIEIAGEAGSLQETMQLVAEAQPDVITLDLMLPDGHALDCMADLRQLCPQARILVLTAKDDPELLPQVISAGADGYVVKIVDVREVVLAIRSVYQGRAFIILTKTQSLGQQLFQRQDEAHENHSADSPDLSQREREVLAHVAQGFTSQQIADMLFLSTKTIETYRARLTKKLGLKDRAALVKFAIQSGCLTVGNSPT